MVVTALYTTEGMLVTLQGASEGHTVLLPHSMTVAALEHHLAELVEWLS